MTPTLITLPEAATILDVSRGTIYNLIYRKVLRPVRLPKIRYIRLRRSDVETLLRIRSK